MPRKLMTVSWNRRWLKAGYVTLLILSAVLLLYVTDILQFNHSWSKQTAKNEPVSYIVLPSVEDMDKLSHKALAELYHKYINQVQVLCQHVVRIGRIEDGGWEICEDRQFRPTGPCLVYSFGINNDFSFDDHMASRYSCQVHSFDPSMNMTSGQRGPKQWFHNTGLSDRHEQLANGWNMDTLKNLMSAQHHSETKIDVLKIDIEGYEWQTLMQLFESGKIHNVRQLVIEMHVAMVGEPMRTEYFRALGVLQKLYDQGFRIYYTHRNLWCKFMSQFQKIDEVGCHEVSLVNVIN